VLARGTLITPHAAPPGHRPCGVIAAAINPFRFSTKVCPR
jgi:hypothetical protein